MLKEGQEKLEVARVVQIDRSFTVTYVFSASRKINFIIYVSHTRFWVQKIYQHTKHYNNFATIELLQIVNDELKLLSYAVCY